MRFYDKVLDKEPIREPQQNFTIEAKQYHLIKLEFIDEPRQISAGTDPDWIILTNAKTYEEHHIRLRYYSAPAVATTEERAIIDTGPSDDKVGTNPATGEGESA
ncbi:unnamed protein product, partial [Mesorhabditis spiculigera]